MTRSTQRTPRPPSPVRPRAWQTQTRRARLYEHTRTMPCGSPHVSAQETPTPHSRASVGPVETSASSAQTFHRSHCHRLRHRAALKTAVTAAAAGTTPGPCGGWTACTRSRRGEGEERISRLGLRRTYHPRYCRRCCWTQTWLLEQMVQPPSRRRVPVSTPRASLSRGLPLRREQRAQPRALKKRQQPSLK
jgi:hypothetical protein